MPGSLGGDSGAGSGYFVMREPPAAICLLLAGLEPRRVKLRLGTLPFLVKTENNVRLLEIYREIFS